MLVHFARQEGVSRTIGDGENVWPLVHRDDLADAYLRALTMAPAGTLLNIVSEPAVPFRTIAQGVAIIRPALEEGVSQAEGWRVPIRWLARHGAAVDQTRSA